MFLSKIGGGYFARYETGGQIIRAPRNELLKLQGSMRLKGENEKGNGYKSHTRVAISSVPC
jgi:hypothetical protein